MSCLHGPPLSTRYRGRVGYIAHVHHCDINARVGETSLLADVMFSLDQCRRFAADLKCNIVEFLD